ncbi:hypothetical protein [Massilia rubra]|uniref:Vitamin K epoxide reductase n=1 Tax=Massilia rubra TaxID=2607910 RepID=A0ABX0LL15_9BURK|nr:hypothetical protein [Massilia rubra]NHZ32942.1 hypothetical protein [Massilia rubra]
MKNRLTKLGLIGLVLAMAMTLAFLSAFVERTGPQLAQYGNLCGPAATDPCYKPVLKGGFPVAYLLDAPGVSRERQLAFVEDHLSPAGLILDVAVYFVTLLIALFVARGRSLSTDCP